MGNHSSHRTAGGILAGLSKRTEAPILLFTLVVYLSFFLAAPNFRGATNFMIIVQQIAINGIVALGMTMVIMIGGMDLSVGSILSLCGVCGGMLDNAGLPVFLTIVLTLCLGMLAGAVNGLLITKLHIPDIIVTLATMNIFRGVAVIITGAKWVTDFSPAFKSIGSTVGGFLCIPVIIYAMVILFFSFMLHKMNFGRKLYALGGNPSAASLMGMNVDGLRLRVYVLNGLLLAMSGLMFASMMNSIQAATAATGLQFQTMSAALIGGANIFGGAGSVLGTVAGSFLMGSIKNGLVQIHASEYWLDFFTGAIILLALIVNLLQSRKWRRKQHGNN